MDVRARTCEWAFGDARVIGDVGLEWELWEFRKERDKHGCICDCLVHPMNVEQLPTPTLLPFPRSSFLPPPPHLASIFTRGQKSMLPDHPDTSTRPA